MAIAIVGLILVTAVALAFGWAVSWFIPVLSLFEGTVIILLAVIVVGTFLNTILRLPPPSQEPYADDPDYIETDTIHQIPISQFTKSAANETWEAYFQYEFANSIYEVIGSIPPPTLALNQQKLQDLAIDLSKLTVSLLQDRKTLPKQISVAMLRRHITKHQLTQDYDDNILQVVVTVINYGLDYHREQLTRVVKHNLWHAKTNML